MWHMLFPMTAFPAEPANRNARSQLSARETQSIISILPNARIAQNALKFAPFPPSAKKHKNLLDSYM